MGKKDMLSKKRKAGPDSDEEEEAEDAELEAELAALRSIQREAGDEDRSDDEGVDDIKKPSYNREGMQRCVNNMGTLPFIESQAVSDFQLETLNENDDLEREMAFYNHTLQAVSHGFSKLKQLDVPVIRPKDFFCENLKTDSHMAKIKDKLILEEKKMAALDSRKNRDLNKKFNKKMAAEKHALESQNKKKDFKEVSKLRKGGDGKEGAKESRVERHMEGKSFKRLNMDKKYGFGGKEKIMQRKMSDKKSLNDMSAFNPKAGKHTRGRKGSSSSLSPRPARTRSTGPKKAGGGNRPGKSSRDAKRAGAKSR
jgi:rRNA-processing protein EBP2